MKYKDIPLVKARVICRHFKRNCEICPLRYEEKEKTLLCRYTLLSLHRMDLESEREKVKEWAKEEIEILENTEIKYSEEVKELFKKLCISIGD